MIIPQCSPCTRKQGLVKAPQFDLATKKKKLPTDILFYNEPYRNKREKVIRILQPSRRCTPAAHKALTSQLDRKRRDLPPLHLLSQLGCPTFCVPVACFLREGEDLTATYNWHPTIYLFLVGSPNQEADCTTWPDEIVKKKNMCHRLKHRLSSEAEIAVKECGGLGLQHTRAGGQRRAAMESASLTSPTSATPSRRC